MISSSIRRLRPAPRSSGAFASRAGTFTGAPTAGQTVTITHTGSPALVLTASTTSNLGLNFQIGGTNAIRATNLADAIARNGGTAGVTATSAAAVVTVTSLTSGNGAQCHACGDHEQIQLGGDYPDRRLGHRGTADNRCIQPALHPPCGTTPTQAVPTTYSGRSTPGTGAFTETSPVLSIDGTQVAFVQRTGTAASLVLLKWSSTPRTVGAPAAPTSRNRCALTADVYRTVHDGDHFQR